MRAKVYSVLKNLGEDPSDTPLEALAFIEGKDPESWRGFQFQIPSSKKALILWQLVSALTTYKF